MGCAITELLSGKEVGVEELAGKALAVDTYNQLYMFLSSIRQRDGTLLMDSKGRITSHLSGLFFRFSKLMQQGLKFVFVFDGKVPELKEKERERRAGIKVDAQKNFEAARDKEDVEEMRKYASRTSKLSPEMLEEAKQLIHAMGHPIVQAPSEGEAQAAYLVKKGLCFGVMSQDADSLLFGAPTLVKNLSLTKKRKQAGKLAYQKINPEIISLNSTLEKLGISHDQLIALGILVGTDYNIGGVKGLGPNKALKLVKQHKNDFESLFRQVNWDFDYSWKEVFDLFSSMNVEDKVSLEWKPMNKEKIREILVETHEFSSERIEEILKNAGGQQKGLGEFF